MKRKRIGILSMQRVKNYGSFLQAFALKKNSRKHIRNGCLFCRL